jgi:hypothetical protein
MLMVYKVRKKQKMLGNAEILSQEQHLKRENIMAVHFTTGVPNN